MPAAVSLDEAWATFARAADDQLLEFMAARSSKARRKLRGRELAADREVLEAARVVLTDVQTAGVRGLAPAAEASDDELRAAARECVGQALEAWWAEIGAPTLRDPDRRRQLWWWISERVAGELLPRP